MLGLVSCWSSSIGSWKASTGFGSAVVVAVAVVVESPSMSCSRLSDAAYLRGLGLVGGGGSVGREGCGSCRPTGWWVLRAAYHHLMT